MFEAVKITSPKIVKHKMHPIFTLLLLFSFTINANGQLITEGIVFFEDFEKKLDQSSIIHKGYNWSEFFKDSIYIDIDKTGVNNNIALMHHDFTSELNLDLDDEFFEGKYEITCDIYVPEYGFFSVGPYNDEIHVPMEVYVVNNTWRRPQIENEWFEIKYLIDYDENLFSFIHANQLSVLNQPFTKISSLKFKCQNAINSDSTPDFFIDNIQIKKVSEFDFNIGLLPDSFFEDFEEATNGNSSINNALNWNELLQDSIYLSNNKTTSGGMVAVMSGYQNLDLTLKLPNLNGMYELTYDAYFPKGFFPESQNEDIEYWKNLREEKWIEIKYLLNYNESQISVIKNNELSFHIRPGERLILHEFFTLKIDFDIYEIWSKEYYVDNIRLKKVENFDYNLSLFPNQVCPYHSNNMQEVDYRIFKMNTVEDEILNSMVIDSVNILLHQRKDSCHFDLYIANLTPSKIPYNPGAYQIKREAKDENGVWKSIENVFASGGKSFCGGGVLPDSHFNPNDIYRVQKIPRYEGNFETEIRFRVILYGYGKTPKKYYSKPYRGSVNKNQFVPIIR